MVEAVECLSESMAAAQLVAEACGGGVEGGSLGEVEGRQRAEAYASVAALVPQAGDEVGILGVQAGNPAETEIVF